MIIDSFDNKTKPMITFYDFYGEQKHLIDYCLVIFSWEIFEHVLKTFECEQIASIRACNGNTPIYKFHYEGKEVGFYLTAIGSAGAAQFVLEANWLTGASKFVMFGSAGSLNRELTDGKYVIPTETYRDEGMSYHYAPASDYIKVKNWQIVKDIFDSLHIPNVAGRIWTTDAILRETRGNIKKRQDDGCIAVEMEVAGVQAVCDFHNLDLYNFIVPGDVLSEEEYDVVGLNGANHDLDKFYVALEIVKRI